jgi:hypothetical protein
MSTTSTDNAIAIFKAALSAVPYVGGPLASLLGDYVPTSTQRNIQKAVDSLESQLTELADRIDADAVDKEEFSELFKTAYLIVVRSHHEERTRAATRLVANILLRQGDGEKLTYTELDHFARCLDQLSIGALRVVTTAVVTVEKQAPGFIAHKSLSILFEQLQTKLPDLSPHLLMGLISELVSFNLMHRAGSPSIRTPDYANYSLEVTPLGARFVSHVIGATTGTRAA